jgi:hypothetical protein
MYLIGQETTPLVPLQILIARLNTLLENLPINFSISTWAKVTVCTAADKCLL